MQVKAAGCPSQAVVWQWPFHKDTAHASTFLVLDPGKAVSSQKLELLSEACHLPGGLLNTAPDFTWLSVICWLILLQSCADVPLPRVKTCLFKQFFLND